MQKRIEGGKVIIDCDTLEETARVEAWIKKMPGLICGGDRIEVSGKAGEVIAKFNQSQKDMP
jgi:hypothetical protein